MGEIVSTLEILYAVDILEYHNKNWLSLDDKMRNEEKRALIERTINNIPPNFLTAKCRT